MFTLRKSDQLIPCCQMFTSHFVLNDNGFVGKEDAIVSMYPA